MDQPPIAPRLPPGWADDLAKGRADVAAGRVVMIDTEALCREIEAEAEELERGIAAPTPSPK